MFQLEEKKRSKPIYVTIFFSFLFLLLGTALCLLGFLWIEDYLNFLKKNMQFDVCETKMVGKKIKDDWKTYL